MDSRRVFAPSSKGLIRAPSRRSTLWTKLHDSSRKLRRTGRLWSLSEAHDVAPRDSSPELARPVDRSREYSLLSTSKTVEVTACKTTNATVKTGTAYTNPILSVPTNSWPLAKTHKTTLISSGRNVQIVISPIPQTSECAAASKGSAHPLKEIEAPTGTLHPAAITSMTNTGRDDSFLRAAPSSIGQSFQYLRDPNSTFLQRNDSQASLANSVYSASASEQDGSNPRNSHSAQPQPTVAGLESGESRGSGSVAGLLCNVHHTTGKQPPALIGSATVISGDKLYVFGGRRLSRKKPQMTRHLYELDLIRRHWTLIEARGAPPPSRYFHSLNALGDTKLVCYGGMTVNAPPQTKEGVHETVPQADAVASDPNIAVLDDLHIYDIPTHTWTAISAQNVPAGRYAHCATILPSFAVFSSTPSLPQNGRAAGAGTAAATGSSNNGYGGAELIIVGGQDDASRYIEQINVFNLRSLTWSTVNELSGNYGAYRTVVAPLIGVAPSDIGSQLDGQIPRLTPKHSDPSSTDLGTATVIYSNYNFLDVKLELKIRLPNGRVLEHPVPTGFSPPGLRFPNGGVIANHFVVSGTYLTSTKQEYAFWALNLRTLAWHRVETGSAALLGGSWNRGLLWSRRNTYVVLGDRRRSLADDYNQRRTNFADVCTIELEAFGLYDNPRVAEPASGYNSASAFAIATPNDISAGGRACSSAAAALGRTMLGLREFSDMDFLALGGERVPVNSTVIAARWGSYFEELRREAPTPLRTGRASSASLFAPSNPGGNGNLFPNSATTLAPSITSSTTSDAMTLLPTPTIDVEATPRPPHRSSLSPTTTSSLLPSPTTTHSTSTTARPTLYLPHTLPTIHALTTYLYTSQLPATTTPQTLTSLLQLARPYRVSGLLEATVALLHAQMSASSTGAVFNAAAMAAGGGDAVRFASNATPDISAAVAGKHVSHPDVLKMGPPRQPTPMRPFEGSLQEREDDDDDDAEAVWEDESVSEADEGGKGGGGGVQGEYVWSGGWSAVIGLQKRGLRGLVEGRRMRSGKEVGAQSGRDFGGAVGLGIV